MPPTPTVFLLSPAHSGGKRAAMLVRAEAEFELAVRFRSGGAELGEVFSFLSGLYFRGKMAYSGRFGSGGAGVPPALVITTSRGLLPPETVIGPAELTHFSRTPVDLRDPAYAVPLEDDVVRLREQLPAGGRVVLLGSLATAKYVDLLLHHLGERLFFPEPFLGMGDMQRGSLMLRAAVAGEELPYRAAAGLLGSRSPSPGSRTR
jgi:hypothetical protein